MCNGLWKSVENPAGRGVGKATVGQPPIPATQKEPSSLRLSLRACSACAGDYQDPDRTAWPPELEIDEEWSRDEALDRPPRSAEGGEEFPAEEA